MNAVVLAVVVMLVLSVARVNVVISLFVGALVGGFWAKMPLNAIIETYQNGLSGGAVIALTYALLGVFAVSLSHSGLPQYLADKLIKKTQASDLKSVIKVKYLIVCGLILMGLASQTVMPIHIAFIFMVVPPLIAVFNALNIDRRLVACVTSFGLVTGYMMFPWGFGSIYLNQILLGNIEKSGMSTTGLSVMQAMAIPALGMLVGLCIAVFWTYRKPRIYAKKVIENREERVRVTPYRSIVALLAVVLVFLTQLKTDSMLMGALVGILVFMASGAVRFKQSENVFNDGMKMMAMIGFIMISAQGFAAVMQASGQIKPLVDASAQLFAESKGMAAFVMLLVGLLVTMGIGSSFSTVPIIAAIYVPLCLSMGFSPLATVAIVGTAGALGDTGSPASDSTLGPSAGLSVDGQHDHIRDTVIPTFLHFNLPLLAFGWLAAMVL